jgi:predicted AAA+ superfamily ATPase
MNNPHENPYAPGAGTPPPELAGRDEILESIRIAIRRNISGKSDSNFLLVGLRGVGKTVLLNKVEAIADDEKAITNFIEISINEPLSKTIIVTLRSALLKLDRIEQVKQAWRVLKSFIEAVKIKHGDTELSIDFDGEPGVADSGNLTLDLADLFVATGEAAKARKTAIVILIDEIQNMEPIELEALIMAVHRINQKKLPIMVVGAGLPNLIKLTGDAKSYAERLFKYPDIGPLNPKEAKRALVQPAEAAGVKFAEDAVDEVIKLTKGYPYFLQEWGYQAWNTSSKSPITISDIRSASQKAEENLDKNFFRSRYERLSNPQKVYLRAMAKLGTEPQKTSDIAKEIGKDSKQLSSTRDGLIEKGMIYSPEYGLAAFTVPMFDEFLKRTKN